MMDTDRGDRGARDAREWTLVLLADRAAGATVCPSEVAKKVVADDGSGSGAGEWREAMPHVHAAVDRLLDEDYVRLSWKGKALDVREGPYRIGRGTLEPKASDTPPKAPDNSET